MVSIKKLPLTVIPLLGIIIISIVFFFLPENTDLISAGGDMILGEILGIALVVCLVFDYKRFKKKNK